MKIAVTYENENVFPHFGRTESFKVYDVEDGKVVPSEIISSGGAGHEALAGFLAGRNIDALICGGMGDGAQAALFEAGIEVCAGAEGNADAAVEAFLKGELKDSGVNCDHHSHDEGGCGGGCGSCGGCGHHHEPLFEGRNVGKKCTVHYKGTFNDGKKFDSSYDRDKPIEFVCGMGMMILGFDKAVAEMEPGEIREIHLMPEEAYGPVDPDAIFTVEKENLAGCEDLKAGEMIYLSNSMGQPFPVTVAEVTDSAITFDANHEMAGKELNFRIELVDVQ